MNLAPKLFHLRLLGVAVAVGLFCAGCKAPVAPTDEFADGGKTQTVKLARGSFPVQIWPSKTPPRALVLFGSGDGGWTDVETNFCRLLAAEGCVTVGIDCRLYAKKDYDQKILADDWAALAAHFEPTGEAVPIIYGGWSMGAEQAVPAALLPGISRPVLGLLMISPGVRGRYGLRISDEMGIAPKGENTFGLRDYATAAERLRIVQMHGKGDFWDSLIWLNDLKGPNLRIDVAKGGHDYSGTGEVLSQAIHRAIDWILASK